MIVELGHVALVLAFALAVIQSIVPLWGTLTNDDRLMATSDTSSLGILLFVAISFASLMWSYASSDFSVVNVWQNSHSQMPFLYKLTGTWGNHEGSMLLWVFILALFAAAVSVFGRNLPRRLSANVQAVQAWMLSTFLLFILLTSNPFERQAVVAEGQDLNPILQDIGLAIHPPMLYLGYVGFSITFAFAIAALIDGKIDSAWARWVRPWAMIAWVFLTAGIAMGSYWAYYELGWGGWWFWDPVENASFMPWLVATALLHSAVVVERRGALKIWTVLLSIIAFSLSLLGTFLVRSGVLTSVHSFASDPERGVFILLILCIFIGGALALFAWRAPTLKAGGLFAPISRESALVLNNLILSVAAVSVLTGTLYPLLLEALTGAKISVGPPYFNLTFGLIILPLLLIVPFGPMLSWKRADIRAASQRLLAAAVLAVIAGGTAWYVMFGGPVMAGFGIAIGVWLIAGAISELAWRAKLFGGAGLRRLFGLPRSAFGTSLAHAGLGIVVLGVVGVTAWREETVLTMEPGQTMQIAGMSLTYRGEFPKRGPNYRDSIGRFELRHSPGAELEMLSPAKRIYFPSRQPTSEVAIRTFLSGDLYVVMGDKAGATGRTVRVYFNPLIPFLWIGTIIMFFGGLVSLTDRRFRVGAPKRAKAKRAKA